MQMIHVTDQAIENARRGTATAAVALIEEHNKDMLPGEVMLVSESYFQTVMMTQTRKCELRNLTDEEVDCTGFRLPQNILVDIKTYDGVTKELKVTSEILFVSWSHLITSLKVKGKPTYCIAQCGYDIDDTDDERKSDEFNLANFVVPFDKAKTGDVVAVSLPLFEKGGHYYPDEGLGKRLVAIRDGNHIRIAKDHEVPQNITSLHRRWFNYGIYENSYLFLVGLRAQTWLTPYMEDKGCPIQVFYFADFAVATAMQSGNPTLSIVLPKQANEETDHTRFQPCATPENVHTALEAWLIAPTKVSPGTAPRPPVAPEQETAGDEVVHSVEFLAGFYAARDLAVKKLRKREYDEDAIVADNSVYQDQADAARTRSSLISELADEVEDFTPRDIAQTKS